MDQTWQFAAADGLQYLYGGYSTPLTVYNAGPINVQLTEDVNGTSTGFPLQPGSSIVWDAGRPLNAYVQTGVAGTAVLVVLDNGGQISNPTAIANALLTAGLATAIGNAISITGAPPINVFDQFATLQFTSSGANFTSVIYDVSKYQSVNFFLGDAAGAFGSPLPRRVDLQWLDSTGTIPLALDTVWLTDTNNNPSGTIAVNTQGRVPTRSGKLRVIMYTTARTGTTCQIFLQGSYRTVAQLEYKMISGYFGVAAAVSGSAADRFASMDFGAVPASTVLTDYPPEIAGNAEFSYRVVLTAGGVGLVLFVNDLISGKQLFSITCPANVITQGVQPLIIPNRPISVVANAGAAVVVTQCLTSLAYQT